MNKGEQLLGLFGVWMAGGGAAIVLLSIATALTLTPLGRVTPTLNALLTWICGISAVVLLIGGILSLMAWYTTPGRIGVFITGGMIALAVIVLLLIMRAYTFN